MQISRARYTLAALAAFVVLAGAGCTLPQWRVFQKTVPSDTAKPAAQIEGERRAASYIAKRSAPPVANPGAAVADIHAAATGLTASLGEPAQPVTVADLAQVVESLRAANRAKDAQLDRWKEFGRKYAGKPLEETGINLAGPAGLLALAGIVAACIACPALGYILLRVLPILWGFFKAATAAVSDFTTTNPDAGANLKNVLSRKMDSAHKRLVRVRARA